MTTRQAPRPSSQPQISHELAVLAALGSVVGVELGAALGKGLFDAVPPTTAAWLRFAFAGAVLLGMRGFRTLTGALAKRTRRPKATLTRQAVVAAGAYVLALTGMNWSFYQSIQRIPLGIAVTFEYLGPLVVALVGSRGRLDLLWVGLAGLGVALLGFRPVPLDPIGLLFIAMAATCWAGYIVLGARARQYWRGSDLVTMACVFGALVLAAPAIALGGANLWTPAVLLMGLLVGVLSSVLPYLLDITALGRLSPGLFGILQSLAPAAAAIAGWLLLGEILGITDWLALVAVVVASAGATVTARHRPRPDAAPKP